MERQGRSGNLHLLAVGGAVLLLLSACARGTPAPVHYRPAAIYKSLPQKQVFAIPPIPAEKPAPPVRAVARAIVPAAKPQTAAPRPIRQASSARYHRVAPGETIYAISKHYGIQARELVAANDLPAPYTIAVGQSLRLPKWATTPAPAAARPTLVASLSQGGVPLPQSKPAYWRPLGPPPPRSQALFAWPVRGRLLSSFGSKPDGLHNDGINIAARQGAAVSAAEAGVVAYVGNELRGFGNLLLVRHADGWMSAYAHVGKIAVHRGQTVRRGQTVAEVGRSGRIDRPQLHFELRKGSNPVDPLRYLAPADGAPERGLSRDARLAGPPGPG